MTAALALLGSTVLSLVIPAAFVALWLAIAARIHRGRRPDLNHHTTPRRHP